MNSINTQARVTGFFYLIIIICGLFAGLAARENLIVYGDASTTAQNLLKNETIFRIGFIGDLIMTVCDVIVALMLYKLLAPVSKHLSLLAAFFRIIQAAIIGLNMLNHILAITILNGNTAFQGFSAEQLESLASLFLSAHSLGYLISNVFFAFSCLALSSLFYKSNLFPKIMGYMVGLAGLAYLYNCFMIAVFPDSASLSEMIMMFTSIPTELFICLFLLIKGTKNL